jgi:preprotein translocase subunit SecB
MVDREQKMSPKEYRKQLNSVNLQSILFNSYTVKSYKDRIESDMKIDIKNDSSFRLESNDNYKAIILQEYKFKAYKKMKSKFALQINCVMEIELVSDKPIDKNFMEIYLNVNLNHNTWPYLREFVQDATLRVGIPPLTLPFFIQ